MSDTGSRGLHKLAGEYYQGKLGFAAYRRERTRLLDSITLQVETEATLLKTRPMHTAGQKQVSRSRGRLFGWILAIILITIITVAWSVMLG